MIQYLIVFIGAGIGGAMRHGVNLAAAALLGSGFGYGTLAVNVVGSLAMGALAAFLAFQGEMAQPWRLFLATGVLGGFTTFSAFSLDAALLFERGQLALAAIYVLASVIGSIAALFAGLALVRQIGLSG
jgi:CrcB protein